jgi:phenylalanyl-tRNA synthetase beta subunit
MWYNPDLLSNHPTVVRDISIFAPKNRLSWGTIHELIRSNGGPTLRKVNLLEFWEHGAPNSHKDCEVCKASGKVFAPATPEGYVCLFIKTVYQHTERTLTNIEVNERHDQVRNALARAGAILR